MLNTKQEKFIQNIVKGMSQRQAYKDAYNAQYSDKAIDEKASTLFNSEKVQERYKELIEELKEETIMSAKERMIWLTEVINDIQKEGVKVKTADKDFVIGEGTADLNTKMKAIDILNKMSGEYTTKLEGNIDGTTTIRVDLDE
ncbi:terminase small subunit [uncultured Thomasclavelia sp.]|uniref:terminase small subunit n=1 Tax=uncultured Thomasclavelia sp. TaxID=3025759 RepID=UPI0025988031|nr:terminase small subunit [uncultured Thomasclavelia sp.]